VARWRLVLLWLAGMDLRITVLAVPPLLPLIHAELQLNEKGVAALASLPVLLLGVAAVPGATLVSRVGARSTLVGGLFLIGIASALRGFGSSTPILFAMTILMGIGIAISQTSMPALVRQWFPATVARATGVWSNGLLIGELLGAALTLPLVLPLVGGAWEAALALWAVPVLISALIIALSTLNDPVRATARRWSIWPDWHRARTWQLGTLQSAASLIYFGANTFLPDYLHVSGQTELIGPALTAVNLAQVPASILVGLVPWGLMAHRRTALAAGGLALASLGPLLSHQPLLILLAAGMLGFIAAYVLVVCFALPALLANESEVAQLTAGASAISYTTAFVSNLAAGALWDATQMPLFALMPLLAGTGIILGLGPRLLAASASSAPAPPRQAI
jgi:CP family cyanate transporter-like MFS transporter